jgi:hypothetical protein
VVNKKYGAEHQALRRRLLRDAIGRPCVRCGVPIKAGEAVDLDHHDDGHPGHYKGLAHASCNRSAGAARGNRQRGDKRRQTRREHMKQLRNARVAVDVAYDREHTSIVTAGTVTVRRFGEVVSISLEYVDGANAIGDVLRAVEALDIEAPVVLSSDGNMAPTAAALTERGIKVAEATPSDRQAAHATFLDHLKGGRLRYHRNIALSAAVRFAETQRGPSGELVEKRGDVDLSPMLAAELAAWAVSQPPPPDRSAAKNIW